MGSMCTGIQVVLVVVLFQGLVQGQVVPSLINPDPLYYQSQESNEKIEYMCVSEELENHLDVDPAICQTKCRAKSMLNHQLLTGSTTEKLYRAYLEKHNQMAQGSSGSRKKRSASFDYFNFPDNQWPLSEPIKFKFDQGEKEHAYIEKEIVRDAFRKWQAETCIRFEEYPTNEFLQDTHLVITKGTGCISFVGKGEVVTQPLFLAGPCFDEFGSILHEIGHVVGLWHETQRPDRNDFVKIIYDNVADYESGNFVSLFGDLVNTNDIVFDYSSIMTFHPKSYSKKPGNLTTMETLDPLFQRTIGQRAEISFNDSRLVNELYCEDWCSTKITCRNSGYQDPNYCSRCRCPDGFTGTYCERFQGEQDYEGERCGGALTVDDSEQEISSPGYDTKGHYNNNQYCVWTLKTRDPTKQIDITIDDDFGIYCSAHQSCYQWLEIRYKNNMFDLGPRWCCNDLHAKSVRSERNEAMVIFKAKYKVDEARLRRGFKIRFRAYPVSTCQQLCQNGRCRNDKCVCNPGYIGEYCTTKEDFCKSRPCRNGGTCIDGLGDYTCLCDSGFRGPQCQQVQPNCGACNGAPSFMEIPCEDPSQTEVIQQMCCRDVTYTAPDGSLSVRQEFYQCNITRNLMYCCDNAELIDMGTMSMCAVTGWTGWSGCDADCGACGKRRRYNYFVSRVWNNGLEKRELDVDLEVEPCNFRTCTTQDCWWAPVDRCQCPCCGLYVDNGYGMCVPSGIVVD